MSTGLTIVNAANRAETTLDATSIIPRNLKSKRVHA